MGTDWNTCCLPLGPAQHRCRVHKYKVKCDAQEGQSPSCLSDFTALWLPCHFCLIGAVKPNEVLKCCISMLRMVLPPLSPQTRPYSAHPGLTLILVLPRTLDIKGAVQKGHETTQCRMLNLALNLSWAHTWPLLAPHWDVTVLRSRLCISRGSRPQSAQVEELIGNH